MKQKVTIELEAPVSGLVYDGYRFVKYGDYFEEYGLIKKWMLESVHSSDKYHTFVQREEQGGEDDTFTCECEECQEPAEPKRIEPLKKLPPISLGIDDPTLFVTDRERCRYLLHKISELIDNQSKIINHINGGQE